MDDYCIFCCHGVVFANVKRCKVTEKNWNMQIFLRDEEEKIVFTLIYGNLRFFEGLFAHIKKKS